MPRSAPTPRYCIPTPPRTGSSKVAASGPRSASESPGPRRRETRRCRGRLRTGVDAYGRIVAHESHALFDGGAYAAGKPTVRLLVEGGVSTLEGYRVPAARHEAATVYTNNVPGGHMRAPGQPQNVFASESHLDLIARELGITPLEMRRRNVARAGHPTTTGDPWHGPDPRRP